MCVCTSVFNGEGGEVEIEKERGKANVAKR